MRRIRARLEDMEEDDSATEAQALYKAMAGIWYKV